MDRFDALVSTAPQMPREFVMSRLNWPLGLRLYAAYQPHDGEDWMQEQPKVDSYEDRWNALPFEKRISLGLEWRLWYATEMNRLMEENGPLHTTGRVLQTSGT